MREKKGNRRHTTLSLLNADAKALCLRPDPELVKVSRVPARRRSVESCPSAAADEDLRSPPPARRRARGGVAKNTRAFATLRRRKTRRVVIGRSLNCWGESTSPMKARRPVELRGSPGCIAYLPSMPLWPELLRGKPCTCWLVSYLQLVILAHTAY